MISQTAIKIQNFNWSEKSIRMMMVAYRKWLEWLLCPWDDDDSDSISPNSTSCNFLAVSKFNDCQTVVKTVYFVPLHGYIYVISIVLKNKHTFNGAIIFVCIVTTAKAIKIVTAHESGASNERKRSNEHDILSRINISKHKYSTIEAETKSQNKISNFKQQLNFAYLWFIHSSTECSAVCRFKPSKSCASPATENIFGFHTAHVFLTAQKLINSENLISSLVKF